MNSTGHTAEIQKTYRTDTENIEVPYRYHRGIIEAYYRKDTEGIQKPYRKCTARREQTI
jgi:hypothetical protein